MELPDELALTGFSPEERTEILDLMPGGADPNLHSPGDPDALLAADALRFSFVVADKAEAALVRSVLAEYGMTGGKDAARALIAALTAAREVARKQRRVRQEVHP